MYLLFIALPIYLYYTHTSCQSCTTGLVCIIFIYNIMYKLYIGFLMSSLVSFYSILYLLSFLSFCLCAAAMWISTLGSIKSYIILHSSLKNQLEKLLNQQMTELTSSLQLLSVILSRISVPASVATASHRCQGQDKKLYEPVLTKKRGWRPESPAWTAQEEWG